MIKELSPWQKETNICENEFQLDELNGKIGAAEAKIQEAKVEARDKLNKEIGKLRQQHSLAATQLDELKAASEETWEDSVGEMEKLGDALKDSYNYFKSLL